MKTNLSKALGCLLLTGTCCLTQAQDYGTYEEIREGAYFEATGGAAFMQDFDVSSFTFGFDNAKAKADTGYRFDVIGGYQFNQHLAVELNTGVLYNQIDSIGGLPVNPDRLEFWQTPLMADLVFTLPLRGPVSVYIGGGAGGVFTTMNLNVFGNTFSDTDCVFGYQAIAGFKYALTEVIDLGVGYKFMGTQSHDWNDGGVDLSSDEIYTHAVLATFTFRF